MQVLEPKVAVQTSDLVIGRMLQHAIYDQQGVLLLAPGAMVNERFMELLRQREIDEIHAEAIDARTLTAPVEKADLADCVADLTPLGTELSTKLDNFISTGSLFVKNTGASLQRGVVLHGCHGYDARRRARMADRHKASAKALDGMLRMAIQGQVQSADAIAQMAGHYLTSMTGDMDMVMSVASEVTEDQDIPEHCLRMSMLSMAIAIEMGYDAGNVHTVGMCALVHDWGMLKVPRSIRQCPRKLTDIEAVAIKRHPIYALEMLEKVAGIPGTVPLVCYQVHERPDGSGYPRGRTKLRIHPFARILNVADTYVTLTTPRPYRPALMAHSAMECLVNQSAEGLVDSDVVQKLLIALSLYPIGSLVELSDRSIAQSIRRNDTKFSQPIVRIVQTALGEKTPENDDRYVIDLANSELTIERPIPVPGRNEVALTTEMFESYCL